MSGWCALHLQLDVRCNATQLAAVVRAVKRVRHSTRPKRHDIGWVELSAYLDWHADVYGSGLRALRVRCALSLAFMAFLRVGEYSHCPSSNTTSIRRCDVDFGSPDASGKVPHVTLFLPSSKTDAFDEGDYAATGVTGDKHCPVRYLQQWMEATAHLGLDDNAPLFNLPGSSLTSSFINRMLVTMASATGYTAQWASHPTASATGRQLLPPSAAIR